MVKMIYYKKNCPVITGQTPPSVHKFVINVLINKEERIMWFKAGHIQSIFGAIILIVALLTLSQPLKSQMVNKQSNLKSTVALLWLFNEINSTDNFFIIRESLYEPTLMLESWMLDPSGYSIFSVNSENLLTEEVFVEPEMQLENWMMDLKCFCKNLPEKFCDDILEMEDWMCCPFKIR